MTVEKTRAVTTEISTRVVAEAIAAPVDVSVVIPCLNEANSIGICVGKALDAFKSAGLRGEVVVADNGSTDGSVEIAEKLARESSKCPHAATARPSRGNRGCARPVHHHGRRRRQL